MRRGEPPLQAHQKFDANVLADLEKGTAHQSTEDLDTNYTTDRSQLGWKMATIILAGALMISILIIVIILMSAPKP